MKSFMNPEMDIILLNQQDAITTSDGELDFDLDGVIGETDDSMFG